MDETLSRIRQLRAFLGLKQTEFSQRIKMAGNSISQIETGKNPLNDRHIAMICNTFNVNEAWLRNGEGEMFTKEPHNPSKTVILDNEGNPLSEEEDRYIKMYRKLVPENPKLVLDYLKVVLKNEEIMLEAQKNTKTELEAEKKE